MDSSLCTKETNVLRKLLLCLLDQNKLDEATDTLHSMSETTQSEPLTIYLAFKLALRTGDHELSSECLERFVEQSPDDPQYLYACCVDARSVGDQTQTIKSLDILATKYDFNSSSSIHFPAVLRTLVRLQMKTLQDPMRAECVCQTFERGMSLFVVGELRC